MEKVIDGKKYNTETATVVCDIPCSYYNSDFKYHDTKLYRTKKGAYFLAGEGGAMSMWASYYGNAHSYGSGIRVISKREAMEYAEIADLSEEEMIKHGFEVEEG